jgi:hypothetical protein
MRCHLAIVVIKRAISETYPLYSCSVGQQPLNDPSVWLTLRQIVRSSVPDPGTWCKVQGSKVQSAFLQRGSGQPTLTCYIWTTLSGVTLFALDLMNGKRENKDAKRWSLSTFPFLGTPFLPGTISVKGVCGIALAMTSSFYLLPQPRSEAPMTRR